MCGLLKPCKFVYEVFIKTSALHDCSCNSYVGVDISRRKLLPTRCAHKMFQPQAERCTLASKFSSRIPWRQKLERVQESKIVAVPPRMQPRFGTGSMLIPKPLDVDTLVRQVPKGKLVTITQ